MNDSPFGETPLPAGEGAFRLIADAAPVPIWVTQLDRTRSFANQAYVDFLGVSYEAALAFDWRAIIHSDDMADIVAQSIAGEASLAPFRLEGRYRRADGEWRWLQSVSNPRFDAAGNHVGFVGVAHDVTEAKTAELSLRERESQLTAFIEQATAGFAQVDLTGRFTVVNDRFCEIAGWSREELIGQSMQSITHPDDRGRNRPLFERAVAAGTPYTHEKRYVRKDGGIIWVNNSVSVVRRANGEPFGVLAVTIDVTERREAEAAMRRSAESVRLAVEGAGMATWELDFDTMSGEWSENRFELLGLPKSPDRTGTFEQWLACIHPSDRDMAYDAATRCFEQGIPYAIEYRIIRPDTGEERWVQSHGSRIDSDEGEAERFVGVSFDVTDRKRADEALRESETRYRTIFEEANDFLISTNADRIVTSVNPAVLAALGYREDEIVGHAFSEFVDLDAIDIDRDTIEAALASGDSLRVSLKVRAANGRERIWEISARRNFDSEGGADGVSAIARDVTEAKRFEAHQQLLIDELNHRVKNTLAIVQGISLQTFKGETDMAAAREAFEGRLAALSDAHNLLTREHWAPVSIRQIIGDAMAALDDDRSRFVLAGPDVTIEPKTAISLALAMHELGTNAVKHGALSRTGGRVAIDWDVIRAAAAPRLTLVWSESGGPPVTAPTRRGFGTRMIERGLAAEFGGTVTIDFAPEGLRCIVDAPLPKPGA